MAKSLVSHVMDPSLTGTAFTDSLFVDVGALAVTFRELKEQLGHDFFIQEDLIIRTASGGGGTLLVETTDYVLSEEDTLLSAEVTTQINDGSSYHVYKKIQIINATYQTGNLYASGKWVGDGIDAAYYNAISPIVVTKSADYTVTDTDYYKVYMVTAGTATKTITLPTVADNKNGKLKIIKADSGYGPVLVDGEGAETINGLTHVFLWSQYDCIELMSTGTEWVIVNDFKPYFYSGWKNQSDWTNVHLGFTTITIDTLVGTPQIGDKVTGATNGSYGILIYTNGTTSCVLASLVGGGGNIFENNEALSFDLSGATAAVDMVSHLKNIDSNVYHGFAKNLEKIQYNIFYATASNGSDAIGLNLTMDDVSAGDSGLIAQALDTNNFIMQTGNSGIIIMSTSGLTSINSATNGYYSISAKLLTW